jgi:hypothetical protein
MPLSACQGCMPRKNKLRGDAHAAAVTQPCDEAERFCGILD